MATLGVSSTGRPAIAGAVGLVFALAFGPRAGAAARRRPPVTEAVRELRSARKIRAGGTSRARRSREAEELRLSRRLLQTTNPTSRADAGLRRRRLHRRPHDLRDTEPRLPRLGRRRGERRLFRRQRAGRDGRRAGRRYRLRQRLDDRSRLRRRHHPRPLRRGGSVRRRRLRQQGWRSPTSMPASGMSGWARSSSVMPTRRATASTT